MFTPFALYRVAHNISLASYLSLSRRIFAFFDVHPTAVFAFVFVPTSARRPAWSRETA